MTDEKRALDVAWTPQAQRQLATADQAEMVQTFLLHRHSLQNQKEGVLHQKALAKIDQVFQSCTLPISCAAGCSACCHGRVDISKHEKRLIMPHIKAKEVDRERLHKQCQALEQGVWDQLPFADRRCVLLDAQDRCSIYENRPLLCRRYFVTSEKSHCYDESWEELTRPGNIDADAYLSAVFTKFKFEALPLFLRDQLQASKPES